MVSVRLLSCLILLFASPVLAGASSVSTPADCPGPSTVHPPVRVTSAPTESTLRQLLLVARTVRDMPKDKKEGERALSLAADELRILLAAHPTTATLRALAGERDLLLVQYRGFPVGMSYGSKAQAENDRALQLDPQNPEARLSKGIELYFKPWFVGGSVPKALDEFERANALRPHDPRILSWIGIALHRLGRPNAKRYLEEAVRLCPQSPLYVTRARTFDPRATHP